MPPAYPLIYRRAAPFEGPEMTKACIDILGDGALLFPSGYPHNGTYFPDTVGLVLGWE